MKFCPICGTTVSEGSNTCPKCGGNINNVANNSGNIAMQQAPTVQIPPVMSNNNVVTSTPQTATTPTSISNESLPMQKANVSEQEFSSTLQPNNSSISESKSVGLQQVENKKSQKGKKIKTDLTPEEREKKFNRITTVIIILISIISLIVLSIFMYSILRENKASEGNNTTLTTQYNYEGFEFFLPNNVVATVEEDNFVVRDKENTWSAVITVHDGAYNTLTSNKSQISGYFEELGYVATTASEKEISGSSFISTEVLMGSKNVLIAYSKASGTKIFGVVYTNELGTYDNQSLAVVGEILASAVNTGYDSAMPEGFNNNMFEKSFEFAK